MKCNICSGAGVIEKKGVLYSCECESNKRLAQAMPMNIQLAEVTAKHLALPVVRAFNKSVFVKGSRTDINSIIKTLFLLNPSKWIKLTSDVEIRNIYVGSMSKAAHSADYDGEVYNNLQELVEPPDLVIIHLGVLSNKNKAAPGALEEALTHRFNKLRPVWAFSTYESPFTSASYAFSPRVSEVIDNHMIPVVLPKLSTERQSASVVESSNIVPESSQPEPDPPKYEPKKKGIRPRVDIDGNPPETSNPLDIYGAGVKKKNTFGGRS